MIKVGVVGYGNLGKGVLKALAKANDMELVGIFTRRDPSSINPIVKANVYSVNDLDKFVGKIDVMILCGGSATDLPNTTKEILKKFNTVDSFDTHAKIPEYFDMLDKIGKESDKLSIISVGWDPGLFSLSRIYFDSVLPDGDDYTFWGKGVSQGHSDAIRRIEGVKKAVQYTIPKQEAVISALSGDRPTLSTCDKHIRECFVVISEGSDEKKIEKQIKEMPNYFLGYETIVNFISEEEFDKNHTGLPHGGFVLRTGSTDKDTNHRLQLSLKLDSNPEFTGSVVVSFARANYRLYKEGNRGARTVFDIAPKYLSPLTNEELRRTIL